MIYKEISEAHFDKIAAEYDFWKKKNWYYYKNLIALYGEFIPEGSRVLEIGCGTGDVLENLKPASGRGIDISGEMIAIAKKKHANKSNLNFEREDMTLLDTPFEEDYIYLADVLEHVGHMPSFLQHLARRTKPGSTIVISVANPLWEPLLMLAEKFGMKMPEGPHERYGIKETERLMEAAKLRIIQKGFRLLVPKPLPGSDWVNARFSNIPLVRRFGFVIYWVLRSEYREGK